MPAVNALDQLVGDPVPGWTPPPVPSHEPMVGRFCRLEPLARAHTSGLWESYALDTDQRGWTYLSHGPYADEMAFALWVESAASSADPQFSAVIANGTPVGVTSYLRITPAAGTIEVGHIHFSPRLQRTSAATEAMYLMMRRAFEGGYRRDEWKCDSLNTPSRAAAARLGFSYEGIFRHALVTRGRNRDTAWFACVDAEWPALQRAYLQWLAPQNVDDEGRQRRSLGVLMAQSLAKIG